MRYYIISIENLQKRICLKIISSLAEYLAFTVCGYTIGWLELRYSFVVHMRISSDMDSSCGICNYWGGWWADLRLCLSAAGIASLLSRLQCFDSGLLMGEDIWVLHSYPVHLLHNLRCLTFTPQLQDFFIFFRFSITSGHDKTSHGSFLFYHRRFFCYRPCSKVSRAFGGLRDSHSVRVR